MTSALLTLLGVIVGAYLTYHFGLKAQIEISEHKKRQEIYSRLMGLKGTTAQLYLSYLETQIILYYSKAQWKREGRQEKSPALQETRQQKQRLNDLLLEIVKNDQSLFEIIGLIKILFSVTPKLNELINRIYNFKSPNIPDPTDGMNVSQINSWQTKAVKDIQKFVKDEYIKPIGDLLNYINKFVQKHKVRW